MATSQDVPAGATIASGALSPRAGTDGGFPDEGRSGVAVEAAHDDGAAAGARAQGPPAWIDQLVDEFVQDRMQAASLVAGAAQADSPASRAAEEHAAQVLRGLVLKFLSDPLWVTPDDAGLEATSQFVDWLARR